MACDKDSRDAVSDLIGAALLGPRKVSGDAGSVEQHSIEELIAADQYLAAKCAASSPRRGLRFTKIIPPGTD